MADTNFVAGFRVLDYGDAGLLLLSNEEYGDSSWNTLQAFAATIEDASLPGCTDIIPAYDSLLLLLDYTVTDPVMVRLALARLMAGHPSRVSGRAPRTFQVPVVFGGDHGPDLRSIAVEVGLTVDGVVGAFTGFVFTVRCLAGPLAMPLLDAPPLPREVRRLARPRIAVPTGSLAVAGRQSSAYTVGSPGGWPLIGRSPGSLLRPAGGRPRPLPAGRSLRVLRDLRPRLGRALRLLPVAPSNRRGVTTSRGCAPAQAGTELK
ncbi:carboxyltransferase domain-containing protein [Candidatus Nephthysia bennettiae]|uniref:Carboxyltransferase domain-containing protein n=1 Tax=Candidatus Nephthysia bennettiae TaxID=3127016 RepID=A0A934KD47_9BACT|nr:carboxyltransferase domain-containing protein [Candidatus Dormibacteraeota bacterium]